MQDRVKAVTMDLNRESIEKAKTCLFDNLTTRKNSSNFCKYSTFKKLDSYYQPAGYRRFQMDLSLTAHCDYNVANLVLDAAPVPVQFDIIFCRNVFIYFDNSLKEKMFNKFYDALKPDGFLVIGYFYPLNLVCFISLLRAFRQKN